MLTLEKSARDPAKGSWLANRLLNQPIIYSGLDPSIGDNIQGPSLIRVPAWIENPLGNYYLYFADHKGKFIRLAFADQITGPWQIHVPGALQLGDSCFPTERQIPKASHTTANRSMTLPHSAEYEGSEPHIASPDVHVDHDQKRIVMYFHGLEGFAMQRTRVATSTDGIGFVAQKPILSPSYLRVVPYDGQFLAFTMPGILYQAKDWFGPFEPIGSFFNSNCRHMALMLMEQTLFVFWTQVGDAPEHIKVSWFDLTLPVTDMVQNDLPNVLQPELAWEGADQPLEPSVRSVAYGLKNQLRDPAVFVEDNEPYLLYAGGGEAAIGIARLAWQTSE